MNKVSNKFLKYCLYIVGIFAILYSVFWLVISVKITNGLNNNFAGKNLEINKTNSFKFGKATFSGFPFKVQISLHDLVEQNASATINHDSTLDIGYSLLGQSIYSVYEGKSSAHYLPIESGFGTNIEGKYTITAQMPIQKALFKSVISGFNYFHILYQVNNVSIKAENVRAYDMIDKSVIIDESNTSFNLKIHHHRKYNSIEDFKTDIPKAISMSLKTSSKDTSAIFRKPLPFSIVYGTHLGSNSGYEAEVDFKTSANNLDPAEIFSKLKVSAKKINFYDSYLSSKGSFEFERVPSKEKPRVASLKYKSDVFIKDSFVNDIDKNIKSMTKNVPQNSMAYYYVSLIEQYDVTKLNINTKDTPIKLSMDAKIIDDIGNRNVLDIEKFTVGYNDKSVDFKVRISNDLENEPIEGIVQTQNLADVVKYFVDNYFAIYKYEDEEISPDFWTSLCLDYLQHIANSISIDPDNALFEFYITNDIPKSKLGKYDLAQGRIIYYRKMFEHLTTYYQSRDKAIKYLRSNAPQYINEPKIFEKITGVK